MKKWHIVLVVIFSVMLLTACGDDKDNEVGLDNNDNNRTTNVLNRNVNDNNQNDDINTARNVNRNHNVNDNRDVNNNLTGTANDNVTGTVNDNTTLNTTTPVVNNDWQNNYRSMNTADSAIASKVARAAAKQRNVDDARALVYGDRIFIALQVDDNVDEQKIEKKVRAAVKKHARGKNIDIVTDGGSYDQMGKVLNVDVNNNNE